MKWRKASVYPNGGFNKIIAKASRATAVGTSIIALLSVLMDKIHSIKWLRVVCKALFEYAIFGIEEMQVMQSVKKYYFKEQRELFAPWKVLRSIDLSAVGGLNYNGIEVLQSIECVEKGCYQHDHQCRELLMSSMRLGKISFLLKESFVSIWLWVTSSLYLKTFILDEIAQTETVKLL